jgi:hypothetical protein
VSSAGTCPMPLQPHGRASSRRGHGMASRSRECSGHRSRWWRCSPAAGEASGPSGSRPLHRERHRPRRWQARPRPLPTTPVGRLPARPGPTPSWSRASQDARWSCRAGGCFWTARCWCFNGRGASVGGGSARRWGRYTCTQTLFQGDVDRGDVTFDVTILSATQLKITASRYGPRWARAQERDRCVRGSAADQRITGSSAECRSA